MTHIFENRVVWVVAFLAIARGSLLLAADEMQGESASTWKIGTPIVGYWFGPTLTDAAAQQMADGGWNLVWCYDEKQMDVAQRHGLRAQFHHDLDRLITESLDNPKNQKELDALIDRVSRHPAMYSYFLIDEPGEASFHNLGRSVAYLRRRDPSHMAYINLLPCGATNSQLGTRGDTVTAYQEYLRRYTDVVKPSLLSYDHYQFIILGDLDDYFFNLAAVRKASQEAGVPFLNTVQASIGLPGMRVPGCDEMRYLAYTTLAYGAQGISYYEYQGSGRNGGITLPDGTPRPIYHTLKSVNREFVAIATELQPLRSLGAYHAGMMLRGTQALADDAPFRLDPPIGPMGRWPFGRVRGMLLGIFGPTAGKPTRVLVVNLDYKAKAVTTLVGPGDIEIFDAANKTWSSASGNRAALSLLPGGGKLLRLALPHDRPNVKGSEQQGGTHG